jgi:hypothetical protein
MIFFELLLMSYAGIYLCFSCISFNYLNKVLIIFFMCMLLVNAIRLFHEVSCAF